MKFFREFSILIILLLVVTLLAAFDQKEGDFFEERHSFSHIKTTLSEFLSVGIKYLSVTSLFWIIYLQSVKYRQQIKIAAILATGFFFDFLLESNIGWFHIDKYVFGYRSVAFIIFGIVTLTTIYKWAMKEIL